MPTYQYACPDCDYKFELKQKFTDDPVKRCPRCERRHVYRVVGPVAVSFKGTGWYVTDSKKSNSSNGHSDHNGKKEEEHKEPTADSAANNGTAESKASESKDESKTADKAADTASKPVTDKTDKTTAPAAARAKKA
jgi:putative FmdB family regulatory protein